jgi:hypothetical protein
MITFLPSLSSDIIAVDSVRSTRIVDENISSSGFDELIDLMK